MDLQKLLKKRKLTGRELGILWVTDALQHARGMSPLYTPEKWAQMFKSIETDEAEKAVYTEYTAVYNWIMIQQGFVGSYYNDARFRSQLFNARLIDFVSNENFYQHLAELPLVMTEKQYKETRDEALFRLLYNEDGTNKTESALSIIYRAISHYIRLCDQEPKAENPLRDTLAKYEGEPVKSELILSRWNKAANEGYYILEDGTRSDRLTREEWKKATSTELAEEYKNADPETQHLMKKERAIFYAKEIYNGKTIEEAEEAADKWDLKKGYAKKAEWKIYEEPPAHLTKADALTEEKALRAIYPHTLGEQGGTPEEISQEAADFITEFEEAVEIVKEDINKRYSISFSATQRANLGNLYEVNYYGFKDEIEAKLWDDNKQAKEAGIAILKGKNGTYTEKLPPDYKKFMGETDIFTNAETRKKLATTLNHDKKMLLDALFFLRGYNIAVDLFIKFYDVSALRLYKIDEQIEDIERRIDDINNLVLMDYWELTLTPYRDAELKEQKKQAIKEFFPLLDQKDAKIPREKIEEGKRKIESREALLDIFALQRALMKGRQEKKRK